MKNVHFSLLILFLFGLSDTYAIGGEKCEYSGDCKAGQICLDMGENLRCVQTLPRKDRFNFVHWGVTTWDPSKKKDRIEIGGVIRERIIDSLLRVRPSATSETEKLALRKKQAFNRLYKSTDKDYFEALSKVNDTFEILHWETHIVIRSIHTDLECIESSQNLKQEALCWAGLIRGLGYAQKSKERFLRLATIRPDAVPGISGGGGSERMDYLLAEALGLASGALGGMIQKNLTSSPTTKN